MVASARVVAGVQTASFLSKTFFFAHAGDEMSSLACRACSLCRAPVVHPELYPEFERTLNKRVQKGYKDGYKVDTETGAFGLQGHNSGAVPVQFRIHNTIHIKDTRGYISGSSRKTRCSSGAVPSQFRHTTTT